jgi:bifunctional DNase/RNase
MSKKPIEIRVADITPSGSSSGAYTLVMQELHGDRRLPVVIGGAEAQAIAIELEKLSPSRPLTHDLFRNLANAFNIVIEEVLIYNLVEGIFFSKLIAVQDGNKIEIDSRTSDAVAIAVRFNCPIYCLEFILTSAGVRPSEGDDSEDDEEEIDLAADDFSEEGNETREILEHQLKQALEDEDYERASKIRDEIKSRFGE